MKVMIFSLEHDAWWKPQSRGYTKDQDEAGWYDEAEAEKIVEDANKHLGFGSKRNEVLVRPFGGGW